MVWFSATFNTTPLLCCYMTFSAHTSPIRIYYLHHFQTQANLLCSNAMSFDHVHKQHPWDVRFVRAPPALVRNKHCSVLIFQHSTSDDLVTEDWKSKTKLWKCFTPWWHDMTDDQERLAARADLIFAYHHHLPPLPLLFLTNIIFMTINMIIIFTNLIII